MSDEKYLFSETFLKDLDNLRENNREKKKTNNSINSFAEFFRDIEGEVIITKEEKPCGENYPHGFYDGVMLQPDRFHKIKESKESKEYNIIFLGEGEEIEYEGTTLLELNAEKVDEIWKEYSKTMSCDIKKGDRILWEKILYQFDLPSRNIIIEDYYLFWHKEYVKNSLIPIIEWLKPFNKGNFIIISNDGNRWSEKIKNIIENKFPEKIFEYIIYEGHSDSKEHDRRILSSFHSITIPVGIGNLPEGDRAKVQTEPSVRSILGTANARETFFNRKKYFFEKIQDARKKGISSRA
ncbi:MAG: hypothetical protein H8E71_04030 [Candidatus Marinimicrobia bacterium]|nr:hypothetical protein [Candidatus Neomarinimicrobiota bacterium]